MKSALTFLIAAKRCEIAELQQLTLTSALVTATGALIHALQRERGLSNLYLASQGTRWASERLQQVADCQALQDEVLASYDRLNTETLRSGQGARLFSHIAYVLQGLDALPHLRARVQAQAWTTERASAGFARLIGGLLAVVFEAADSAADPEVSRRLVAMFNFMQGKEFVGQERATGSAMFAAGRAEPAAQQRMLHLIESQERCLQVFTEFGSAAPVAAWREAQHPHNLAARERLRRVLCTATPGATLDRQTSQPWFDACTVHMDAMKLIEDDLAAELQDLCAERIKAAMAELAACERMAHSAPAPSGNTDPAAEPPFFDDPARTLAMPQGVGAPGPGYGLQLDRSILEMVQAQAQRLQSISDELETVRASLNERKVIERAKGLLMAHRTLSEEDAHKTMRGMAMNQNRRLVDVAEAVLAMADVLPERRR